MVLGKIKRVQGVRGEINVRHARLKDKISMNESCQRFYPIAVYCLLLLVPNYTRIYAFLYQSLSFLYPFFFVLNEPCDVVPRYGAIPLLTTHFLICLLYFSLFSVRCK